MEDFILREMEERGADGVDFVPVWFDTSFPPVYKSYTKQEWIESDGSYPRTNRMYWRMENGQKVYITKPTKVNYNNCPFREQEDITPYRGDVFDHPTYAFFCLKDGKKEITNIKCRNCDYITERGK